MSDKPNTAMDDNTRAVLSAYPDLYTLVTAWMEAHGADEVQDLVTAIKCNITEDLKYRVPCKALGDGVSRKCCGWIAVPSPEAVHEVAKSNGWYDDGGPSVPEAFAFMHSEISEALEAWRDGAKPIMLWLHQRKPEGIPAELADVVLRVLDFCGRHGVDIALAINEKHRYNQTRPHRHGGKRA